jgi:hypothetical protein
MTSAKSVSLSVVALSTLVAFSLSLSSCRNASYENTKDKKKEAPKDLAQNPANPNAPTAKVETLKNGVISAVFAASEPVTIRPASTTADPDDVGKSQCVNPGITKITYALGDGRTMVADRPKACENPAVTAVYNTVGSFTITMTVTTAENETASATTVIQVGNCGTSQNPCNPAQNPAQNSPVTVPVRSY